MPKEPANRLKRAREEAGYSVRRLAEETDLTRQLLYALESGARRGSLETWQRISRVLQVHLDDIAPALIEEPPGEEPEGKVLALRERA